MLESVRLLLTTHSLKFQEYDLILYENEELDMKNLLCCHLHLTFSLVMHSIEIYYSRSSKCLHNYFPSERKYMEINAVFYNRTTNNLSWCPFDVKKKGERNEGEAATSKQFLRKVNINKTNQCEAEWSSCDKCEHWIKKISNDLMWIVCLQSESEEISVENFATKLLIGSVLYAHIHWASNESIET